MSAIALSPAAEPVRLQCPAGHRCVSTSIGAHGEAMRLFVPDEFAQALFATEVQPGWASFPKTHTEQSYSAIVSIVTGTIAMNITLPLLVATYPIVQTLPGNEILVVAPRCERAVDGTHEQNTRIYRLDGSLARQFCLGDGIEHVQADAAGNLWVGYSDEGVFGNLGWGASDKDSTPMGAAGLVCYDRYGRKLWQFKPPDGLEYICDCYAVNVTNGAVWACYYTDFPIVRIDRGKRVRAWITPLRGPRELAVSVDSVLAYGGYGDDKQACCLLKLREAHAERIADVNLILPEQIDLRELTVLGRGSALHAFAGDKWYTFNVPSRG